MFEVASLCRAEARRSGAREANMCLAIPMRLSQIDGLRGITQSGGVCCEVRLDLLPQVRVGDHVLVHAGYAIEVLDETLAAETLELLAELGALEDGAADGAS